MLTFAMSDVHGYIKPMETALVWADTYAQKFNQSHRVVFCGDYIDRGPNSMDVLQLLMDGLDMGLPWVVLMGNHEQMMLNTYRLEGQKSLIWKDVWLKNGGVETVANYQNPSKFSKLEEHLDFIQKRMRRFHDGKYHRFVHAGVRGAAPLSNQKFDDLLWIKPKAMDAEWVNHPKLLVHGHTPKAQSLYQKRLNLDGGMSLGGVLRVAVFENDRHLFTKLIDKYGKSAGRNQWSATHPAPQGKAYTL